MLILAESLAPSTDVRLVSSSLSLTEEWKSRVNQHAYFLTAPKGRIGRVFPFTLAILRLSKAPSIFVLFDFYLLPLLIPLRMILKRRKSFVFLDLHDSARRNRARRPYWQLMRLTNGVIAVSSFIASEIPRAVRRAVVWRPVPLVSVNDDNPGDASSFAHDLAVVPTARVGIVGQVTPDKGIHLGIELLEHSALLTVIVRGAPSGGDQYLATLREDGRRYKERFVIEGATARNQALKNLDFLFVANPFEPFGRVVAEAQSAGVVPVVPNSGGASELVNHEESGLIYEPGDIRSAAEQIERVFLDGDLYRKLSQSASRFAADAYDVDAIAANYVQHLTRMAE